MHRLTVALVLFAVPALAHDFQDRLTDSAIELERVAEMVRNDPRCGRTVGPGAQNLLSQYDQLWRSPTEDRVEQGRVALGSMMGAAQVSNCGRDVSRSLKSALQSLTDAKGQVRSFLEDKRRRGTRDDDRRDDNDDDRREKGFVGEVVVRTDTAAAGAPVVTFTVNKLNAPGSRKSLGLRVQPEGGNWSDWIVVSPLENDRTPVTLVARHDQLRALGGSGRFQAQIALLNRRSEVTTDSVVMFTLGPVAPMLPVPPPALPVRDCGTGEDPGCSMVRNGITPMDRETFLGMMTALKANRSEFTRAEMALNIINTSGVTAKQLGLVMDLFMSEFTKMDLVKKVVARLVNPQHALGLSVKFSSSFNQGDFTKLMTQQR